MYRYPDFWYYRTLPQQAAVSAAPYPTNPAYVSTPSRCKLSARNQLTGIVAAITEGAVNAQVVLDIGGGHRITSIITMASLRDLGLRVGSRATAVVKSSDVMMMV